MPNRRLASLTAAVLLAGSGAAVAAPAQAEPRNCTGDITLQTQSVDADDVFVGTVTDRAAAGGDVVFSVAVDRVYKGDIDTSEVTVTTPARPRDCGVPDLETDGAYVFFTGGADLTTTRTAGTASATDARVGRIERLLGAGRTPTPPEPDTATFTVVAGEPTSLERVAAPGLALVIVGLLGLGLAVGLSRRRA